MISGHHRRSRLSDALLCAATLCASVTLTACGLYDDLPPIATATPTSGEALQNGGFENGDQPWRIDGIGGGSAVIGGVQPHAGRESLELAIAPSSGGGRQSAGVTQSISSGSFPEFVSGFYRVDQAPADGGAYLAFVVTSRGDDLPNGAGEHVVRFVVAGAANESVLPPGSPAVFLNRDAPKLNQWTYFAYPVKQAFADRFGRAPARWESLEVRFEIATPAEATSDGGARAYLDDLYAGPQMANPNRPDGG